LFTSLLTGATLTANILVLVQFTGGYPAAQHPSENEGPRARGLSSARKEGPAILFGAKRGQNGIRQEDGAEIAASLTSSLSRLARQTAETEFIGGKLLE